MFSLTFDIPNALFMNANGRLHHYQRASMTKQLRELAYWKAKAARGNGLGAPPYHVTCTIELDTARRFDPPNAYPTIKALIDGMTDAGIWQDDNSEVIGAMTFRRGSGKAAKGMKRVTIEVVECD